MVQDDRHSQLFLVTEMALEKSFDSGAEAPGEPFATTVQIERIPSKKLVGYVGVDAVVVPASVEYLCSANLHRYGDASKR